MEYIVITFLIRVNAFNKGIQKSNFNFQFILQSEYQVYYVVII